MRVKAILVVFFSLLTFLLFAQSDINQFDSDGKRHGIWEKFHENGNIRYTGEFKHGKEIGVFKFYAVTGEKHPIVIKSFQKDTPITQVQFFSKKGVMESKGQMKGKDRIGEWIYYFNDGKTVLSKENYKNNLLDGKFQVFYKNGKLTELSFYKNGKLHGKKVRYNDMGKEIENITYKDGMMHGPTIIYDKKGAVYAKGSYTDGLKTGIWEFNMDGEMVKVTPDKIRLK